MCCLLLFIILQIHFLYFLLNSILNIQARKRSSGTALELLNRIVSVQVCDATKVKFMFFCRAHKKIKNHNLLHVLYKVYPELPR